MQEEGREGGSSPLQESSPPLENPIATVGVRAGRARSGVVHETWPVGLVSGQWLGGLWRPGGGRGAAARLLTAN